jgi:hypothetical protein
LERQKVSVNNINIDFDDNPDPFWLTKSISYESVVNFCVNCQYLYRMCEK